MINSDALMNSKFVIFLKYFLIHALLRKRVVGVGFFWGNNIYEDCLYGKNIFGGKGGYGNLFGGFGGKGIVRIVGLLGGKGINGGDLSGCKSGYVCYLGRYKGWYSGLFGGYGGFGGSNCGYGGSDSGYQLGYGGYRGSNGGYGLEYLR